MYAIFFFSLIIVSVLLPFMGCQSSQTTRVNNQPSQRQSVYEDETTPGEISDVGFESQDIVSMADRMMRDILSNPFWMKGDGSNGRAPSPRLIIDSTCFTNEGTNPINLNMITDRIGVELNRAAKGRMIFLARELIGVVEKERTLKRQGVISHGAVTGSDLPLGADYKLCGNITTLDTISGDRISSFTQVAMKIVDLETAAIDWSGIYSFRKVGPNPLSIQVWTDQNTYRVGDKLIIHFKSNKDCYLYLYHQSADGETNLIFPNDFHSDNHITAGRHFRIPDENYSFDFTVSPPLGLERIKVLATTSPEQGRRWGASSEMGRLMEVRKRGDAVNFCVIR